MNRLRPKITYLSPENLKHLSFTEVGKSIIFFDNDILIRLATATEQRLKDGIGYAKSTETEITRRMEQYELETKVRESARISDEFISNGQFKFEYPTESLE
jgi:DNA integrity scanning protein DisA with diadenylate cyclase activity